MSLAKLNNSGRKLRMPIIKPNGVFSGEVRETTHSDRQAEHKKMRQTWVQTFSGFVLLNLMIAGAVLYIGNLTILGIFGIIWLTVLGLAWFFSAEITPRAVQAYPADPNTEYGAAAIRCADRAWDLLVAHVTEHYGAKLASLMKRPPVMLAPNKHANAFCTGRGWRDSVIVIFEGAFLSGMSEDEIVAVLGHEFGHFFHLDVFMQTVASVLGAVLSLTIAGAAKRFVSPIFSRLPKWLRWLSFLSNIALLFSLRLTGTLVKVVQMFISRAREASADAFSAELTDDPCALARALKKLVAYETKLAKQQAIEEAAAKAADPVKFHAMQMARICEEAVLDALGLMLFVDTLETLEHHAAGKEQSALSKWWERLNENHPPVEDRCAWLELAAGHACPCPGVDSIH